MIKSTVYQHPSNDEYELEDASHVSLKPGPETGHKKLSPQHQSHAFCRSLIATIYSNKLTW